MIRNLPSGAKTVSSVPSTQPLFVTRRDIEQFEAANPALRGIGQIMVGRGRWVVTDENSNANKGSRQAPTRARPSDTQQGTSDVYRYVSDRV